MVRRLTGAVPIASRPQHFNGPTPFLTPPWQSTQPVTARRKGRPMNINGVFRTTEEAKADSGRIRSLKCHMALSPLFGAAREVADWSRYIAGKSRPCSNGN